jgi:hypothetical protein
MDHPGRPSRGVLLTDPPRVGPTAHSTNMINIERGWSDHSDSNSLSPQMRSPQMAEQRATPLRNASPQRRESSVYHPDNRVLGYRKENHAESVHHIESPSTVANTGRPKATENQLRAELLHGRALF